MKVEIVERWKCGVCGRVHEVVEEAAKCCICVKCGTLMTPPVSPKSYHHASDTCNACARKTNLLSAKASLRRYKEAYENQLKWVAELEAQKPKKGER